MNHPHSLSKQIAKQLHEVIFGGNWTSANYKTVLQDVNREQALHSIHSLNSIATLTAHATYYIGVLQKVLLENKLEGKDKLSFVLPPLPNEEAWQNYQQQIWKDAETLCSLIEKIPEDTWFNHFTDARYGNYYRNVQGMVEHLHYHLGQINLIKKLIRQQENPTALPPTT